MSPLLVERHLQSHGRVPHLHNLQNRGWVELLQFSSLDESIQQEYLTQFKELITEMRKKFTVYQCSRVIPVDLDDSDLKLPDPFKVLIQLLINKESSV